MKAMRTWPRGSTGQLHPRHHQVLAKHILRLLTLFAPLSPSALLLHHRLQRLRPPSPLSVPDSA
eukprot:1713363-Rhodomonas_salina.1